MKKKIALTLLCVLCMLLCAACSLWENNDPTNLPTYEELTEKYENEQRAYVRTNPAAPDGDETDTPSIPVTSSDRRIVASSEGKTNRIVYKLYSDGTLEISDIQGVGRLDEVESLKNYLSANGGGENVTVTKIVFTDAVTEIPAGFCSGSSLSAVREINLGDQVVAIGDSAFADMSSLNSIRLGSGLETIGEKAFMGCPFSTITLPTGLIAIKASAFQNCAKLAGIDFPENLRIGDYAFSGCTELKRVTIQGGLVGKYAFEGCALTDVTILGGEIGDNAFNNCSKLNEVAIQGGTIKGNAFKDCTTLAKVSIEADVESFDRTAFTGCIALSNLTICTDVPPHAFEGNESLMGVEIKNAVSIGENAFSGCAKLKTLTLSKGIKRIGKNAFNGCALMEITFPSTLVSVEKSAFANCTALESAVFTEGTEEMVIAAEAFSGCAKLGEVVLSPNTVSIGDKAFSGSGLAKITFGRNVKTVGKSAFEGCKELEIIECAGGAGIAVQKEAFKDCAALTEIKGFGFDEIGDSAFANCTALTKLNCNGKRNVTLGNKAFENCTALKEISDFGFGPVGENAFSGCTKLETIDLKGNSGIVLENGVFAGCTALKEIRGGGFDIIGKSAFANCGFEDLTIPKATTSIGDNAFEGNASLTEIVFEEDSGVRVGQNAFKGCDALNAVRFPERGTIELGKNAFNGCTVLKSIRIQGVRKVGAYAFNGCYGLVNAELIDSPAQVLEMGESIFNGCNSLGSLSLECQKIGDHAFEGLKNLSMVDFKDGRVRVIGSHAFDGTGLGTVTLNKDIEEIGEYAFANCENLTRFIFLGVPRRMHNYIWDGCQNLQQYSGIYYNQSKVNLNNWNGAKNGWDKDWNINTKNLDKIDKGFQVLAW